MIDPKAYTYLTVASLAAGFQVARQGPNSSHAQIIATATHETHAVEIARALTAASEADRASDTSHVRKFLDLSTSHLPEPIMNGLNGFDGVIAYPNEHGALMWVPDDPKDHAASYHYPADILTVQLYARLFGCDYVLFDADGSRLDGLPMWEW